MNSYDMIFKTFVIIITTIVLIVFYYKSIYFIKANIISGIIFLIILVGITILFVYKIIEFLICHKRNLNSDNYVILNSNSNSVVW